MIKKKKKLRLKDPLESLNHWLDDKEIKNKWTQRQLIWNDWGKQNKNHQKQKQDKEIMPSGSHL